MSDIKQAAEKATQEMWNNGSSIDWSDAMEMFSRGADWKAIQEQKFTEKGRLLDDDTGKRRSSVADGDVAVDTGGDVSGRHIRQESDGGAVVAADPGDVPAQRDKRDLERGSVDVASKVCNRCKEPLSPYPLAHMPDAVACIDQEAKEALSSRPGGKADG